MERVVIIFANRNDVHAVSVATEVEASLRSRAVILDTADYPAAWSLTHAFGGGGKTSWSIRGGDWKVTSQQVAGLWWRRPARHRIPSEVQERRARRFCADEAVAAFRGWLHGLGHQVINPVAAEAAAARKPLQLWAAKEVGLRIPRTLITNDPEEARAFLSPANGPAIFKVLTGTSWQFTETRQFNGKYVQDLQSLRFAPAIFQELIEAEADIRATVVDDHVYAAAIRAKRSNARLDWRLDGAAEITKHALDRVTCRKLIELLRRLGLRFGAIDMRLTREGEYIFLEVNPGGQFLFCEIHAGLPISRAVAESLLSGEHARRSPVDISASAGRHTRRRTPRKSAEQF